MKVFVSYLLVCTVLILWVFPVYGQFMADMHIRTPNDGNIYHVLNDGKNYRYEFEEEGMKLLVLVQPHKNKTYVVFPEKKMYQKMSCTSPASLSNDPVQTLNYLQKNYTLKAVGNEVINGYPCEKREIHAQGQLLNRHWYSSELKFPLKIEQLDQYTMELRNIQKTDIKDPSYFNVPSDFTEVDRQMRPVIPEPPPPESWKMSNRSVPFKGVFKRGDRVEVEIKSSEYHKILLSNQGNKSSKLTYQLYRDGTQLDENEQGPLEYRTKKIHSGESKTFTLALQPGDIMVMQIFYGKMEIDVRLE